jgi:uncharacterized protein YceH (UPF0502 family)
MGTSTMAGLINTAANADGQNVAALQRETAALRARIAELEEAVARLDSLLRWLLGPAPPPASARQSP